MNHRLLVSVILLIILINVVVFSNTKDNNVSKNPRVVENRGTDMASSSWQTYHSEYGFSIDYPTFYPPLDVVDWGQNPIVRLQTMKDQDEGGGAPTFINIDVGFSHSFREYDLVSGKCRRYTNDEIVEENEPLVNKNKIRYCVVDWNSNGLLSKTAFFLIGENKGSNETIMVQEQLNVIEYPGAVSTFGKWLDSFRPLDL